MRPTGCIHRGVQVRQYLDSHRYVERLPWTATRVRLRAAFRTPNRRLYTRFTFPGGKIVSRSCGRMTGKPDVTF